MEHVARGRNYIDGRWEEGDGTALEVRDPATGDVVALVPDSTEQDVDRAVSAARRAWNSWRWVNPTVRAGYLHAAGDALAAAKVQVAAAITREMGKPIPEATGEVEKLAKTFHFYAEEATRITGATLPNEEDGFTSLVEKEPIGVVAAITPWNYPVELIGWKLCAALAAGCTIVVKPSEYTPSAAIEVFRCLEAVELPAGVANLVTGAGATGRALVAHPAISKVAFTGSAATGEAIFKTVSGVKPLSMELGGNCPLIVTARADIDQAVAGALRRSFRNAGQICIAINRAYVHADLYEEFVQRLAKAAEGLVVGDGLREDDVDVGPVTNVEILERCERHVADARSKGARVLVGGARPGDRPVGNYYLPTVLADCTQDMQVMHEETFGPVIGVSPYDDLESAIELANSTPAGLAAYVYSEDLSEVFALGRRLDFGSVAVNNVDAGTINAPYGGRKGSGFGYEHGREGMEGYLQMKHVRVRHRS
ncbi:NAD-dependent succinate-semialdehyde dehydrogenase [Pseudonocardia yunnanensis]|uniref:NAD-dependent succinate-semialdehyde dehydrogenase n=1 Tax=Pseudonocardia yunnanensis TaxID=58107 RepID=A0ABW4EU77_9PSEU